MIEFSLFRLHLDIGVYLRYIKRINNVNTLLTYLVQYMLRFPEVFEDLAALAAEEFVTSDFMSIKRKEVRCDFY